MADYSQEQVMAALRAADAAGDTEAASRLAVIANGMTSGQSAKYDPKTNPVDYQASRFSKGAAGLASLPADLAFSVADVAKRGLRMIPGYEKYVAEPLNSLAPNFTLERPGSVIKGALPGADLKPPSRNQEILGGASEFMGAGGPFGMYNVATSPHKIAAAVGEIGSSVLGGIGSETAGLPGAIIGSVVGQNLPTAYSKLKANTAAGVPWLRAKLDERVPKELDAALKAAPQAPQNMASAEAISEKIGKAAGAPFKPTIAQQTGAPGIIAREEQIAASSPEQLTKYTARASENQAALKAAEDVFFPAGQSNIPRTADSIRRGVASNLESRLDNINRSREALAQRITSSPQQATGQALVNLRNEAQNAARAVKNKMLDDVYATADKLKVSENMDDVVEVARKVGGSDENIFQNMPPVYAKIIKEFAPKQAALTGRSVPPDLMAAAQGAPKKASFEAIHSLWREANTQYATATRVGDTQAQYYIQQVKDALKAKLSKFEGGQYGELTDKFKDFNRFYATKYAPAFYEGVGGRIAANNRYGEVVKPEDVVSKFFNPSGIDDFNLIYGSNQKAQSALEDGVIGLFRDAAVKNGKINQSAANNFLRSNREALDKLPDLREMLKSPVSADAAMIESAARVRQNISEFNKSVIAKIAKTDNPDVLIDKALANKKTLMQLVELGRIAGPGATQSIIRSVVDRIPAAAAKAGTDPLSFVVANKEALKPVLDRVSPSHFENLLTIAGGKSILSRTKVPTHVGASRYVDVVEELTGSTPRTVWSQINAVEQGRQAASSSAIGLLSRYGIKTRAENANALMTEAIYNPEVAKSWAKMAEGKKLDIGESNSFIRNMLSAGIRIGSTLDEK